MSPSFPLPCSKPLPTLHRSPPRKPHHSISLLQISQTHEELIQVHSLLIKTGLIQEKHAFGRLLVSLASLNQPEPLSHAKKLFGSPHCPKSPFVYNHMIKFYSNAGDPKAAYLLFSQMVYEDCILPDEFTYTFVCNACSKSPSLVFQGRQVHGLMVKNPTPIKTQSWNSLMDFHIKSGEDLWRVRQILYSMEDPDVVSWNCLLDGFVKAGDLVGARKLFDEMPRRDTVSWTTLLVGLANAGLASEARRLFDEMPNRSMVSWSAMINGYVKSGQYKDGFALFKEMQSSGVRVDKITLTTLLSACSSFGALDQGRWIHAHINKHLIEADAHLSTALVDMYGKCGRIDLAYRVFRESKDKKVFLWNAMLGGLAMHSYGRKALELYLEMLSDGFRPNEITFICVLSACSHSGLVGDGLQVFDSMEREHKVAPTMEHYGCVVDLLGRAGRLNDARRFIKAMPVAADASVWKALLGACGVHGDVELGEEVGRVLLELEPFHDGNYVLLSNVYAGKKRWKDVTRLRGMMKERGVKKTPGCSSIEVNGAVHEFVARDDSHPQSREIYALLNQLYELASFGSLEDVKFIN